MTLPAHRVTDNFTEISRCGVNGFIALHSSVHKKPLSGNLIILITRPHDSLRYKTSFSWGRRGLWGNDTLAIWFPSQ
jgi:hypothetical protein